MTTYYGCNWRTDGHNYIHLNATNKKFSYRFTAQHSKTVDKVKFYSQIYGTCPTYRVGIQGDSSGEPDGSYIGYVDSVLTGGWAEYDIANVAISEGSVYHIVIQYQSGDLDEFNYAAILDCDIPNLSYPLGITADVNLDTLYYDGSSWTERDANPVFILIYTDATTHGQPFVTNYTYGGFIYGSGYAGEDFVLSENKTFSHIGFWGRKIGTVTLYVCIYNKTDSEYVVEDEEVTETLPTSNNWVDHQFSSPITLISGKNYQFFLKAPDGNSSNKWIFYGAYTYSVSQDLTWNEDTDRMCYTTNGTVPLPSLQTYHDACFRFTEGEAEEAEIVGSIVPQVLALIRAGVID